MRESYRQDWARSVDGQRHLVVISSWVYKQVIFDNFPRRKLEKLCPAIACRQYLDINELISQYCFYRLIQNTPLCCSSKTTSITGVEDTVMLVVYMLFKKSLMFCFIITLAAGVRNWTDFTCALRWLKLLYNHIVYMGNKLIHGKTLRVL